MNADSCSKASVGPVIRTILSKPQKLAALERHWRENAHSRFEPYDTGSWEDVLDAWGDEPMHWDEEWNEDFFHELSAVGFVFELYKNDEMPPWDVVVADGMHSWLELPAPFAYDVCLYINHEAEALAFAHVSVARKLKKLCSGGEWLGLE